MNPRAERIASTPSGPRLQGIKCRECGARSFPPARWCRSCHSDAIDVVELAATGRIEACSGYSGVAFGEVRLDDGLLVAGRLEPFEQARVGAKVRFHPDDDIIRFTVHD
jgi:uncharacterized OB-fold protein